MRRKPAWVASKAIQGNYSRLAVALESFDAMTLAADIKDAEEDMADTTDQEQRDKLARRLDQLKALQAALAARTSTAH